MYGDKLENAFKIDVGFAMHIPLWETPQAIVGNLFAHTRNLTGNVDDVWFYRGSVIVNDENPKDIGHRWGFTLGPYINSQNFEKGKSDDIVKHEYGHTIQSRILGPLYISRVAIPSINSFATGTDSFHGKQCYEVWANKLAGVPESDDYQRKAINNKWYNWFYYTIFPIPITY